ncbi:hypothetical protein CTI12_AA092440 [Artemisia annua]|uniref:BED-type domain-containing protein n=1 Tax=Artemisia annua TaxID=35608 RepID=A0A2U1PZN2_ARTAN|nr:hypothetical protein CTI12_AA092440 [Artemisia annua]
MASQETQEEPQGSSSTDLDQPPLWAYVTKLEKLGATGGAWKFKCDVCQDVRQGSYSRVRAHLLGITGQGIKVCKKATAALKLEMKDLEAFYEQKKADSKAKEVALPCEAGLGFKKRKGSLNPLERAFGVETRDQLDQEIARMFYTGGLPFNLARNPHYIRAFQFAAANKIDGYVPPSYNKLRTTLLQKEKENNICSPNNVEANALAYEQCSWIKDVHGDVIAIKNFIMNHNMRLSIFSKFTSLRLLSVADTRFASIIVMLKRFKLIKTGLQAMVISEEWSSYREDDTVKANFVKEKIVNDEWWDQVSYILSFTGPIYDMIRACDTDKPCLHLVYEMWDSMIEKVKIEIYKKEKRSTSQKSLFYDVVHGILVARWAKNNTPLHCLAHSLNPRYYSKEWLDEDKTRSAPHTDAEVSQERGNCFKRLFPNADEHRRVLDEYALFSMKNGCFSDLTSISMMGTMGTQKLRNWSTYAFIHSLRRNKLTTSRAQDLVYVHNNLRLLSRNPKDDEKMWDVGGDAFDSMEDVGFLEFAELSLDEPEFENDIIDN